METQIPEIPPLAKIFNLSYLSSRGRYELCTFLFWDLSFFFLFLSSYPFFCPRAVHSPPPPPPSSPSSGRSLRASFFCICFFLVVEQPFALRRIQNAPKVL